MCVCVCVSRCWLPLPGCIHALDSGYILDNVAELYMTSCLCNSIISLSLSFRLAMSFPLISYSSLHFFHLLLLLIIIFCCLFALCFELNPAQRMQCDSIQSDFLQKQLLKNCYLRQQMMHTALVLNKMRSDKRNDHKTYLNVNLKHGCRDLEK